MAKKLAVMTMGTLHEPVGHPSMRGFIERIGGVYDAADRSHGFVDRSKRDPETYGHSWGPILVPECFPPAPADQLPTTFSLWDDIESLVAFAYHGAHGEAMPKRREWFKTEDQPTYVLWWVEEGHTPGWQEACERLDHLHEHGCTPFSFDLKAPYDANGLRCTLNKEALRERVALNAGR